jgi:hypothetical protein
MYTIDLLPETDSPNPLSDEALKKSGLNDAQKQDLQAIYPYLGAAQETLVELHVDAAVHLLLEKSLRVFYEQTAQEKSSTEQKIEPDPHEKLQQLNRFLKTLNIMPESVTLTMGNMPNTMRNHIDFLTATLDEKDLDATIHAIADALLPMCHSAASWKSSDAAKGRIDIAIAQRQSITTKANAYEVRVREFSEKHELTEEDRAEVQHYLRELWSWRDGGRSKLAPYPEIKGFPLPDFPDALTPHPLVENVASIAQTLFSYAGLHGLAEYAHPLQILESGQKSLGRIIEKALDKGEKPSELHDLVRASILSQDIGDIGRFQELFVQHACNHPQCKRDSVKVEPWQMRVSGYSDTKILGKIKLEGVLVDFESQQKTPAEREAEMRSHQIYDLKRSAIQEASEKLGDDAFFARAVKGYNTLIATLNPIADEQAGKLIQRYSAKRLEELSHNAPIPQGFDVVGDNFNATLYNFKPLDETTLPRSDTERKTVLNTMASALEDLHILYHFAGAQRTRGGEVAALSATLFDNMQQGIPQNEPSLKARIERMQEYVPTQDSVARVLLQRRFNPDRGHFFEANQTRIAELLERQKGLIEEAQQRSLDTSSVAPFEKAAAHAR